MEKDNKTPGPIKSIFFTLIITLIIVLAFCLSLELVQRVRYAVRFKHPYWLAYGFTKMPNAEYASMHERGVLKKRLGVDVIEVSVKFYDGYRKYISGGTILEGSRINSYGFRGKDFDIAKKEGLYRIVVLGGSTTFGAFVDDGFTYSELLEKKLDARSDEEYEVINAGIGAAQIFEIRNLFEKEILPLKPDMVIVNSVFNNLYYSEHTRKYHKNLLQTVNKFLLAKSLFCMTLSEKMARIAKTPIGDVYKAPIRDIVKNFMKTDSFWDGWKSALKAIIKEARAHDIKVVLITEPAWLRDHKTDNCGLLLDKQFRPVYKKAYAMIKEVGVEEDVPVVDAASYFNALPDKSGYFTDGVHLTEKGTEDMAKLIAEKIK